MNKLLGTLTIVFAVSCSCPEAFPASEPLNPGPQPETRVLSIQEVVQMALGHSPEVMLAKAQIMRAGEAVRETRSLNRPQLYTGTGLAYNNGFPLSIEGSAPSIFQVAATQSIFSKKISKQVEVSPVLKSFESMEEDQDRFVLTCFGISNINTEWPVVIIRMDDDGIYLFCIIHISKS